LNLISFWTRLPAVNPQDEVQRWSARLRAIMRERELSMAAVERGLGWSHGYLRQVLRPGRPALKAEQVLALASFLEVSWADFFAGLYDLQPAAATPDPAALVQQVEERAYAAGLAAVRKGLAAAAEENRRRVALLFAQVEALRPGADTARSIDPRDVLRLVGRLLSEWLHQDAALDDGARASALPPAAERFASWPQRTA
jgi:transcriptional regulator with XRE-family HTH domain